METSAVAIQPLHPGLKGGDCKVAIPYNKGWLEVKINTLSALDLVLGSEYLRSTY